VVICLKQGADLHMSQLMLLPLTVSCFSKIQIGFAFLVPAHPVVLDKGPLNGCVCVSARADTRAPFRRSQVSASPMIRDFQQTTMASIGLLAQAKTVL